MTADQFFSIMAAITIGITSVVPPSTGSVCPVMYRDVTTRLRETCTALA